MRKSYPNPFMPVYILLFVFIFFVFVYWLVSINAYASVKQAKFNVDVLQRFIIAYKTLENIQIQSLNELPDFHIISPEHSLSVKDDDFKQGVKGGYIYDYEYFTGGHFVISASPIGLLNASIEIGITDRGKLKFNKNNVDVEADSYSEVESWTPVDRFNRYRTKDLPDYMR